MRSVAGVRRVNIGTREILSILRARIDGTDLDMSAKLAAIQRGGTTTHLLAKLNSLHVEREVCGQVLRVVESWSARPDKAIREGRRECLDIILRSTKKFGTAYTRYHASERMARAVDLLRAVFGESI